MKSTYTVTKSTPTGDELISIWEDESKAIEEAKSLVPTLKGSEEVHVDRWSIRVRARQHIHAYNSDYDPSGDEEVGDTPVIR